MRLAGMLAVRVGPPGPLDGERDPPENKAPRRKGFWGRPRHHSRLGVFPYCKTAPCRKMTPPLARERTGPKFPAVTTVRQWEAAFRRFAGPPAEYKSRCNGPGG